MLDRRYKILGPLGKGGMGGIYAAEHLQFRRKVAIKVLLERRAGDRTMRERFTREARAVCHLQHPHIVTYHDFGTDPRTGLPYLVMEHLSGRNLARVIHKEAPLPLTRVLHILAQLCDALHEAHEHGIVHRDLKPGNVMLVERGSDPDYLKLIDFGIAKVLPGAAAPEDLQRRLTDLGALVGTTAYLAPEYIRSQLVDARTDIYAVGVMAYELIAGHRPFDDPVPERILAMHLTKEPPPLRSLGDGRVVPPRLDQVVLRAMAKSPGDRFRTARDLKDQLLSAARPLLAAEHAAPTVKASDDQLRRVEPPSTAIDFGAVPKEVLEARAAQSATPAPAPAPAVQRKWVLLTVALAIAVVVLAGLLVWSRLASGAEPRGESAIEAPAPECAPAWEPPCDD